MLVIGLAGCFSPPDRDLLPGLPRWFGHDAAAALIEDGRVLCAVEEERLNRIKHTNRFPAMAVRSCLAEAGREAGEIDAVAYFFEEGADNKELGILYADQPSQPVRLVRELIAERLEESIGRSFAADRIHCIRHHDCHAAAAFLHSGFDAALVGIFDGSGECDSASIYTADRRGQQLRRTEPTARSLGHFYTNTIGLLGYGLFDEFKAMGLAPHGDPATYRTVFEGAYRLLDDGAYELDPTAVRAHFLSRGFRPRRAGQPFDQCHADITAALQETLERIAMHLLAHERRETGLTRLCLSGGVALNCTMNGVIARSGLFEAVFVHPASHDAGAAVGAAMKLCWDRGREARTSAMLRDVCWGPGLGSSEDIGGALAGWGDLISVERVDGIAERAAAAVASGEAIGWVQGRSEFGPRALGARSIIADPRPASNKDRINALVKKREAYRPFAPAVTAEAAADFFELPAAAANLDHMIVVSAVKPQWRSVLGAVTHVDGSARLQVVRHGDNPRFHALLEAFADLTGVAVLLNTSFNNNAEPIVQTVADAVTCFLSNNLDLLAIGDFLVRPAADRRAVLATAKLRLSPHSIVVREHSPGRGERPAHRIRFNYERGKSAPISAQMYEALLAADGRASLGELGLDGDALLDEMLPLWEDRFVRFGPE